ncbi:hypothetical protein KAFR_0H00290 [Kazachstania africana CBS 2517]|uniref:Golgi apparatus membrane protein TVP38 n=1 Tax=Kazachstania africana (strain ATCC 22294 / BCRC 22015 / CBS 2517 / CECT 1963 / NBRC 1671 / NRRL Y-8276) TaxID=1071382 RepID=H2AYN2_KAZAF|nr:hypothetical protein KAFR_0H00290 [Kazachstania africana CBS 2517]CCF59438.1 hypothetical protein KAFR_0H00290 [Kazachstania africana CBS 2517]
MSNETMQELEFNDTDNGPFPENDDDEFDSYFQNMDGDLTFNDMNDVSEDNNFLDMYNLTPRQRVSYKVKKTFFDLTNYFYALPTWQRVALCIFGTIAFIVGILFLIFHNAILEKIVDTSNDLQAKKSTPPILMLLLFMVSFPPLIGYSFLSTSTGLLYGVTFKGWIILSISSVCGSIASFALFQNLLHKRAEQLVHINQRFEALASILQENNSYLILALIRLCPFPYSLTNGALAGIHGISVRNFSLANLITTPKLFVYLFIGSRIKNLAETESTGSRMFDLISIAVAVAILGITASLLYYKTQKRYTELQNGSHQAGTNNPIQIDDSFDI